jgi:alginate O-acetyltransferase complex protein AlgI
MSLGNWLRDYLFIPLGGSRGGAWQTARNLIITMTLCGLWHGADWPYVFFGFLQAVLLIGHSGFRSVCERLPTLSGLLQTSAGTALRVGITFVTFSMTLVIWRAPTLSAGFDMLRGMFVFRPDQAVLVMTSVWWCAAFVALCHALAQGDRWKRLVARLPAPVFGFGHALALTVALLLVAGAGRPFVYFQF